jgi:hypothetical protein
MAHGIGLSLAHGSFVSDDFIPTGISDLVLWLKYNTGYTSKDDETTAAGNIDDNDRIKQWDDQSGNDNHAVQTATADMPRFESDDNSIKFANRAKFMDLTENISVSANTDFTLIIHVSLADDFSAASGLFGYGVDDFFRVLRDGTGFRAQIGDNTNNDWVEASDVLALDTYYIITLTRSNGATGDLTVHVHGGAFSDKEWDAAEGATDADDFTINNVGCETDDTQNMRGFVKDVFVYNGTALSDEERNKMYTYINSQV